MDSVLITDRTTHTEPPAWQGSSVDALSLQRRLEFAQQEQRHLQWRAKSIERALLKALPLISSQRGVQLSNTSGPVAHEADVLAELDQTILFADHARDRYLYIRGWAWSNAAPIGAVELFIDGSRGQRLDYGHERRDVQRHFGGPPEMKWSGFAELIKLPANWLADKPLALHICNEQGAWKRFAIQPQSHFTAKLLARSLKRWRRLWHSKSDTKLGDRVHEKELLDRASRFINRLNGNSRFSFVVLVDQQSHSELRRLYASLQSQIYTKWELILVPLHPRAEQVARAAMPDRTKDARVRICDRQSDSRGDIIAAIVQSAQGSYVGFLDGCECLLPDALAWLTIEAENKNHAWLYGDAAFVDASGKFVGSNYKPDFSDLHLLAEFFTRGLSLYRRSDLLEVIGERRVSNEAEEYDLALRMSRRLTREQIHHISEVLVHAPQSVSRESNASCPAAARVVQSFCDERGIKASVRAIERCPDIQQLEFTPQRDAKVAVVIATRDKARLVRQCLASLQSATEYANVEFIVINNQSTEPELFDLLDENARCADFSRIDYDRPFNHSEMHNEVLFATDAEFVAIVNNDVKDFSPRWLEQLVGVMQLDERIACVSPLLLYPDGRVQHAGIAIDDELTVEHIHLYSPSAAAPGNTRVRCLQDVAACSGACLLVRVSAFRAVGGFDAKRFPVDFNDVDLCIRWQRAGYRCVYQPAVRAVHFECASRDVLSSKTAILESLRQQLASTGFRDPYFSPHLVLRNGQPEERWTGGDARRRQLVRLIERLESLSNHAVRHAA